jgi:hypothetical protein
MDLDSLMVVARLASSHELEHTPSASPAMPAAASGPAYGQGQEDTRPHAHLNLDAGLDDGTHLGHLDAVGVSVVDECDEPDRTLFREGYRRPSRACASERSERV